MGGITWAISDGGKLLKKKDGTRNSDWRLRGIKV